MNHRRRTVQDAMRAIVLGIVGCLVITACASDTPKGPPPPTPDQVRSHGDRTFDKLKQEEQERGTQANMPR
jgi:outer membrane biogenesis lipoprotein LolB